MFKYIKIIITTIVLYLGVGQAFATDKTQQDYEVVRVFGSEIAPVTIHEFSSMTCPACQRYHLTAVDTLIKEYVDTGKVKIVMHQFPLDDVAAAAAMLGLSLPKQSYQKFIAHAFKNQDTLRKNPVKTLQSWARMSGLDLVKVTNNQKLLSAIYRQKNKDADMYKIQGTPTIYINDRKFRYTGNAKAYFKAIDKAYMQATGNYQ